MAQTNPYRDEPMFATLWERFSKLQIDWQATGDHENNQKVYAIHNGQTHAIGFAHELAQMSNEKFSALIHIYFD